MNKSVLVLDKQECCTKCPLFSDVYTDMVCRGNGRTIDYPFPDDKIQDWCPLKDVPEKKNVRIFCLGERDFEQRGYQQGWNACIEEMLE